MPCSFEPMRVPGLSGAVDVASGGASCALLGDGRVRCWGSNQGHLLGTEVSGECDNPFTTTPSQPTRVPCSADPVLVEGIESAKKLAQLGQTCALENRREVKCWGYDYAAATVVPGTEQAIGVASSCALLADGKIRCWGSAESGRLGTTQAVGTCTGPYNQPCTTSALPVALDVASIDVSSGWQHVCAVASDGTLFCWGNNLYGQLGTPADQSPRCDSGFPCEVLPRRVPNLSGVERVFAGVGSTCVLTIDGRALCWGNLPILACSPHQRAISRARRGDIKSRSTKRAPQC